MPRKLLALVLLSAAACGGSAPPVTAPSGPPPMVTVHVVTPQRGTIQRTISQPGQIQAFEQTPIFAKIPGYVLKWCVDIGDVVRKDQPLAELWVPELVSELDLKKENVKLTIKALAMAEAQVTTAKAQLKEAEAGLARADAVNDYWKGQNERFARLVSQSVLDKQTREETLHQYRAASAALTEAQAKIASAKALVQEKEAARDKAEVDIRAAEADKKRQADLVGYATFQAPYDGVVTRRTINTFDFVQPPTGGKGEPLYVIERRDLMRIFVEVPEADAVWVGKGARARVRIPALQGREFSSKVARTSYSLDRTTRTLLAEIDIANPDDQLRPGMYAYATIEGQWPDVLTLPADAVFTEGDVNVGFKHFCWIVEGGRLKRTQIQIGARGDHMVEVLQKRLPEANAWQAFTATEQIVHGNLSGLKDGQTVQVKN
jgi:HlyD family secretion protein